MKKTKKILLSILICIGLLFLISPENTFARSTTKSKTSNCTGECKTCADNVCINDYKITITASDFDRNSWKATTAGKYYNTTAARTVTVTVPQKALNAGANYKIRIFYGDYNTLNDAELFKVDQLDIDEIDADDIEAENVHLLKTQIKKDNGAVEKETKNKAIKISRGNKSNSVVITVSPGSEVLVVAYLSKDVETNSKCTNNSGNEFKVSCYNGKESEVSSDNILTLTGVASSEYVQNPNHTILIDNLNKRGGEYGTEKGELNACDKAYNGIYDPKVEEDKTPADAKKYTIPNTDNAALAEYRQKYYTPILGTYYCDRPQVAFILPDKQIAHLANRALEMFYKTWKLSQKSKSSSSYTNTYDEVDQYVKDLQAKKDDNQKPVVETVTNTKNVSLQCESDLKEGIGSKEYLYVKTDSINTAKLSDNTTPKVCDTICYEHLTVNYDPPVAAIAGICISYKVTVKSETKCGVKYNKDIIEGTNGNGGLIGKLQKNMCSPSPICSGDEDHTQAGPSEEFDKCIKECDNGKYSQSCINKCYKQVYENKKVTTEKNNIEKTNNDTKAKDNENLSTLIFNAKSNSDNVLQVKDEHTWSLDNLKGYSDKSTAVGKCNSSSEILANIDWCSEYFFEAKTMYPKGHYTSDGSAWISDITTIGKRTNVWNAIGRASPFYIRDIDSTKELIKSILDKDEHNGRKYFINSNGIKTQYKDNWVCSEKCQYTGCSKGDALTPDAFVNGINLSENKDEKTTKDDLKKIDEALELCQVSDACDKEKTTTSNFEIKIINRRDSDANNEVDKKGTTELGNQNPTSEHNICPPNEKNPPSSHVFTMFVPADNEEPKSKYGILGWCYDSTTQNPQYQTTITFPGTWINEKTHVPEYNTTCMPEATPYGQQFCFPRDTSNVNVKWWYWHEQTKDENGKILYPTLQEPEVKNNIQAKATDFGKYNWTINYSCFYGSYDDGNPTPDDPNTPPPGENKTSHKNQVYKFKVIDQGKLFDKNSNQKQGYNWTSAAKIVAGIDQNDQYAQTYGIDPQKYVDYLRENEKDEKIYNQNTSLDDYYIYIPSDGINYIKSHYKDHKYTDYTDKEYGGTFQEDPKILGLSRYTSKILNDLNNKTFKGGEKIHITYASNVRPMSNGQGTNNNYKEGISKLK